jgi:hypothetical protein
MTLKEYAELNNITLADAKKRTGLTHWKQEVVADALSDAPEIIKALEPIVEDVVEAVVDIVEVVAEATVAIVSDDDKRKSVKGLGTKSPYWSELRG